MIDLDELNLNRQWSREQKDGLIALARKGQEYERVLREIADLPDHDGNMWIHPAGGSDIAREHLEKGK